MIDTAALTHLVAARLEAIADPERAIGMAAYMKTDMPFYGVSKPGRMPILREVLDRFPAQTRHDYEVGVRSLWELPHREEKYLALGYARAHSQYVTLTSMRLYRKLVVEGAWWDLVDETAIKLIGPVVLNRREAVRPRVAAWIGSSDLWLRRTAIVCQVDHRGSTDTVLLAGACEATMEERAFFIRKAIGWALRSYAGTDPAWVAAFVTRHRDRMSGLSYREATKHLDGFSAAPSVPR